MKKSRPSPEAAETEAEHAKVWAAFPQLAKSAAFHSGMWRRGAFTVTLAEAREYLRIWPVAHPLAQQRIELGEPPQLLTLAYMRRLAGGLGLTELEEWRWPSAGSAQASSSSSLTPQAA